jgi:SAM-dependent methyltransferase
MVSYDHFSPLYEEVLGNRYHAALIPFLLKNLRRAKAAMPARILDLGCGTGKLLAFFRDRGCFVTGLDLSLGMLAEGARKYALPRVNADMVRFAFREPFDIVCSMYDSLNHILAEIEVKAVFRNARCALRPGGVFIFDTNNLWAFRHVFGSREIFRHEDGTGSVEMATGFDRASGLAWAHLNGRGPDGPVEDALQERYYPREDLERWLKEAGFGRIRVEAWSPACAYGNRKVKDFWTAIRK